jgi:hypothetical protein
MLRNSKRKDYDGNDRCAAGGSRGDKDARSVVNYVALDDTSRITNLQKVLNFDLKAFLHDYFNTK